MKNRAFAHPVSWALFGASCLGVPGVGCGAAPDASGEPVAERVSALQVADKTFNDGIFNKLHAVVRTCDYPATPQTVQTVTCDLPSGYVLVGGGAEIEGSPQPGALLTGSYPNIEDYTHWVASSRRYTGNASHRLRVYSIGLKIDGFTQAQLKGAFRYSEGSCGSTPLAAPSCVQDLGFGGEYNVIGGGGFVLPPNNTLKVFLTESYQSGNGWYISAHNNGSGDLAYVKGVVIGAPSCLSYPNGTPLGCFSFESAFNEKRNGPAGYDHYSASGVSGYVVTSIGGYSITPGSRIRFLTDLIPLNGAAQGATVWSKDATVAGGGNTGVNVLSLSIR